MEFMITLDAQKLQEALSTRKVTPEELAQQAAELGLQQLLYRTKNNAKKIARERAEREELAELRMLVKDVLK